MGGTASECKSSRHQATAASNTKFQEGLRDAIEQYARYHTLSVTDNAKKPLILVELTAAVFKERLSLTPPPPQKKLPAAGFRTTYTHLTQVLIVPESARATASFAAERGQLFIAVMTNFSFSFFQFFF